MNFQISVQILPEQWCKFGEDMKQIHAPSLLVNQYLSGKKEGKLVKFYLQFQNTSMNLEKYQWSIYSMIYQQSFTNECRKRKLSNEWEVYSWYLYVYTDCLNRQKFKWNSVVLGIRRTEQSLWFHWEAEVCSVSVSQSICKKYLE